MPASCASTSPTGESKDQERRKNRMVRDGRKKQVSKHALVETFLSTYLVDTASQRATIQIITVS